MAPVQGPPETDAQIIRRQGALIVTLTAQRDSALHQLNLQANVDKMRHDYALLLTSVEQGMTRLRRVFKGLVED